MPKELKRFNAYFKSQQAHMFRVSKDKHAHMVNRSVSLNCYNHNLNLNDTIVVAP